MQTLEQNSACSQPTSPSSCILGKPLRNLPPPYPHWLRGQVAIFMVILFHLFFIFFAMVIHVGLLVYHKINLQNSVDLAAYYGAMKQAEVMNAMAHTNYQIRQAWKLLTFRYRTYGMAGNGFYGPPNNAIANLPYYCPHDYPSSCGLPPGTQPTNTSNIPEFDHYNSRCLVSFCANYCAWGHMEQACAIRDTNQCRIDCLDVSRITLAGIPGAVGFGGALTALGLPGVAATAIGFSVQAAQQQVSECRRTSAMSWLGLSSMIFAYRWDMLTRKALFLSLAQGLSQGPNDFIDLDGGSARQGVLETLKRNLTDPNRESLEADGNNFFFYNSLGHDACKWEGDPHASPKWVQPVLVRPAYRFVDPECPSNPNAPAIQRRFYFYDLVFLEPPPPRDPDRYPPNISLYRNPPYQAAFQFFKQWNLEPPVDSYTQPKAQFLASTVGFEKNPWCLAYVGVKAKAKPKIPFSPLGSIQLEATAVAKPFGGNIGPWYAKVWPRGQAISGGPNTPLSQKTESFLTLRANEEIQGYLQDLNNQLAAAGPNPPTHLLQQMDIVVPNHGSFVGDPAGTSAKGLFTNWLHALYKITMRAGAPRLDLQAYVNIMDKVFTDADVLPWIDSSNEDRSRNYPPRRLEILSILPNQFDLAYYSLDWNAYDHFARRMQNNTYLESSLRQILPNVPADIIIRGDIGFRKGGPDPLSYFSVKHQYEEANILLQDKLPVPVMNISNGSIVLPGQGSVQAPPLSFMTPVEVIVQNRGNPNNRPTPNLTFWHAEKPGDYRFKSNRFGNCLAAVPPSEIESNPEVAATPNDCIAGGRSQYSVKLVDPDFLREPQALGGGTAVGTPLNPPPDTLLD